MSSSNGSKLDPDTPVRPAVLQNNDFGTRTGCPKNHLTPSGRRTELVGDVSSRHLAPLPQKLQVLGARCLDSAELRRGTRGLVGAGCFVADRRQSGWLARTG